MIAAFVAGAGTAQGQAQPVQPPSESPAAPQATTPAAGDAAASEPMAPDAKFWQREDRWTARFEPGAWYPGLGGDVKLPRSTPGSNPRTGMRELNQDGGSYLAPFGEVNIRRGDWSLAARGFVWGSDQTAVGVDGRVGDLTIEDGDEVFSSIDVSNADLEVRYTFTPAPEDRLRPGKARVRTRLDAMGGVRLHDVDVLVQNRSLSSPGNEDSAQELFLTPVVGLKGSIEFYDQFSIDLQLAVGGLPWGDQQSLVGDVLVGGTWKPVGNFGVQLGYRALFFDFSSGDGSGAFELTGSLQGLYGGIVIEF
ncbi:MAG: hypothetical protein DYG92_07830 [Leptolyngbya sp. PLA1]|nr:hypothetical protein [Leptolyngbya sp. PLA1]